MTTITMTETTPRVWIACLSCYNSGRLVGDWFPASIADDVTIEEIHAESGGARMGCEEMWCFDTDNLPLNRELSPAEAGEWGRLLDDVDDRQRDALVAWVRSGDYITEGTGDLPSLPDFEERYAGEWDSFREYAENLVDDLGLLADLPEYVARYFDYDAWTRDLTFEHSTEPASGGGVHVFRTL